MYVAIYIDSLYMLLYESFTLSMSKYILRYSHRTRVYIPNPNDSNLYRKTDFRAVSSHKQTKHMHRNCGDREKAGYASSENCRRPYYYFFNSHVLYYAFFRLLKSPLNIFSLVFLLYYLENCIYP